jgi:hypothetical protein
MTLNINHLRIGVKSRFFVAIRTTRSITFSESAGFAGDWRCSLQTGASNPAIRQKNRRFCWALSKGHSGLTRFQGVTAKEQLVSRQLKHPSYAAENESMCPKAQTMADSPHLTLKKPGEGCRFRLESPSGPLTTST